MNYKDKYLKYKKKYMKIKKMSGGYCINDIKENVINDIDNDIGLKGLNIKEVNKIVDNYFKEQNYENMDEELEYDEYNHYEGLIISDIKEKIIEMKKKKKNIAATALSLHKNIPNIIIELIKEVQEENK